MNFLLYEFLLCFSPLLHRRVAPKHRTRSSTFYLFLQPPAPASRRRRRGSRLSRAARPEGGCRDCDGGCRVVDAGRRSTERVGRILTLKNIIKFGLKRAKLARIERQSGT